MLKKIANKIFDLFVVNRNAMAVQLKDGNYVTKYVKVTENDIYCMLKEKKSIGSYQQLYKSPYVKWICFDFDCKSKENPNMEELYRSCTLPLNKLLIERNISFVNEFSGRRGIHTWVIFSDYIKKNEAFSILKKIKQLANFEYNIELFGLDEFPATPNSRGNILGKQVKVPLSIHSKGKQSYLFVGEYKEIKYDDNFYEKQLQILNSIKKNKSSEVIKNLQLKKQQDNVSYERMFITESLECTSKQIVDILSTTKVYRQIFDRLFHGTALFKDWLVMLGTLGKMQSNKEILYDVFKYCPNFSEEETKRRIEQFGNIYYPATFNYLYNLYDLNIEKGINPNENGLQYLIRHIDSQIVIHNFDENETNILKYSKYTLEKEIKYLFSNDEVPVVSIYLDLLHMTSYDNKKIDNTIEQIMRGENIQIEPGEIFIFERIENKTKTRKMVSLNAYDRVLTSHMALKLFYGVNRKIRSFSYNPNYLSKNDLFFHWYNSWGNYLDHIRRFLGIDLYESMNVITLDVYHFYDSIDFLGIYKLFDSYIDEKQKNILEKLISFNEKVMRNINGNRVGVPQGPAYARMIAETFLGILIENILDEMNIEKDKIFVYRYVDDIIIFHDETINSEYIYDFFSKKFSMYGLTLNQEKSKIYGKIKELSDDQRNEIMRTNQFQYGLKISEYSYLLEDDYIKQKAARIIEKKGKFDISDISFFFSRYAEERAKIYFFNMYYKQIFACKFGRGSGYTLFYKFIFENEDLLEKCIQESLFDIIPKNSINFSCCLARIYYSVRNKEISFNLYEQLRRLYILEIKNSINEIERKEDRSIVLALASQNNNE